MICSLLILLRRKILGENLVDKSRFIESLRNFAWRNGLEVEDERLFW